jgi:hypothetical protein
VLHMVLTINSVNRLVFGAETYVFPVRYELNIYVLFTGNSVFKGLIKKQTSALCYKRVNRMWRIGLHMLNKPSTILH